MRTQHPQVRQDQLKFNEIRSDDGKILTAATHQGRANRWEYPKSHVHILQFIEFALAAATFYDNISGRMRKGC